MDNVNQQENLDLLQQLVRGTEMGKNTLEQMLPLTEDRLLRAELLEEQRGYRTLNQKAHTAVAALGKQAEGAGTLEKLGAKLGVTSRLLGDRSTKKLAEMMVEGTNMGITECVQAQNRNPGASAGAKKLADEVLAFQRDNLRALEQFL